MQPVEIPARLRKFPLFMNRFPIHYTVWVDEAGRPDFKVMHERRREECFAKNLCHLCGERLWGRGTKTRGFEGAEYAFIGGPLCVQSHRFVDGAMHVECAEYAALACPYLSAPSGVYTAVVPVLVVPNRTSLNPLEGALTALGVADNRRNTRPGKMVLVVTRFYRVERNTIVHQGEIEEGGSHAAVPFHRGQLVAVPGKYVRIDWAIMPQAKEEEK